MGIRTDFIYEGRTDDLCGGGKSELIYWGQEGVHAEKDRGLQVVVSWASRLNPWKNNCHGNFSKNLC